MPDVSTIAKEMNIHIHLVAHPHKSLSYIQVDNISGSGDISNKADNVFVLSRIDTGFRSVAEEYLGKVVYQDVINSGCTNIIEVGKFRSKGTLMGMVIKLWFEGESNRLKNNIAEQVKYGWEENMDGQNRTFPEEEEQSDEALPFRMDDDEAPF